MVTYKPIKFNNYWYICLDGVPINTDQYTYASECAEACRILNEGDEMNNPYDTDKYMTYVFKQEGNMPFNPKLSIDGVELKVYAASVYHEVMLNQRLTALLRRIISDIDEVTVDYLNEIGVSNDDICSLGMGIDDIELDNVPANWESEI